MEKSQAHKYIDFIKVIKKLVLILSVDKLEN